MTITNTMAQTEINEKSLAKPDERPKSQGKLKDTLSLASTALPIAGAVGTLGVWLAATFYVGDIQVAPDRPYNTLEIRVSDKKGQESVFHSPTFQLMPGKYHLEVTVDSQFKQHADVRAVFHKNTSIPIHVPTVANVSTPQNAANLSSENAAAISVNPQALNSQNKAPDSVPAANATQQDSAAQESADIADDSSKKRWWQIWKKNK